MDKLKNQQFQAETALTNVGESYEYLRVIAKNSIEIKKLEFLKTIRDLLGKLILAFTLIVLLVFMGFLSVLLMTYYFNTLLDSWPYAILLSVGILSFLSLILYLMRGLLLYKVINNWVNKVAVPES